MTSKLTVITGPMFSGKSEELINRLNRKSRYGKQNVVAFKSKTDTRSPAGKIVSRERIDGQIKPVIIDSFPSYDIENRFELEMVLKDFTQLHAVGFDESQFFGNWFENFIYETLYEKREQDFEILVSGLDMDFKRRPFGSIPALMGMADEVIKLKANCNICFDGRANLTYKKRLGLNKQIEVEDEDLYGVCCIKCHKTP